MDIIHVIEENIEVCDITSINKLIYHYIISGENKNILMNYLINIFIKYYISKNLWLIQEITRKIINIEESNKDKNKDKNKNKNKDKIIYLIEDLCLLICNLPNKKLEFLVTTESHNDKDEIKKIINTFQKEYSDILDFKDIVHSEIYALFNIFYRNILYGCDLNNCYIIIRYLISLKKKQLFIKDIKIDESIIDILFIIIIKFLENNDRILPNIIEYITLYKDLFYYRVKQKDKLDRINILFYVIFVLINRKLKYQIIEYKINDLPVINNLNYLFVKIPYNYSIIKDVNNDKENSKLIFRNKKTITIDSFNIVDKSDLNIIKLLI